MQTCENCEKIFDQKAALLRHISHKVDCKYHYGEERLAELRIDGKLEAKRKWWKRSAEDAKIEKKNNDNKKAKIRDYKKERYVPASRRNAYDGKCFAKFYKIVFKSRKEYALDELVGFAYDKVYDIAFDEAVDLVFEKSEIYMDIFEENLDCEAGTKEFDERLDHSLELAFDNHFKIQMDKEIDNWIDSVNLQIEKKCRWQGEEIAFTHFFNDFCSSVYPDVEKEAMDAAFDNFDHGRSHASDELLENVIFYSCFMKKAGEQLEKFPKDNQLAMKMAGKIDVKVNKQIRFMKNNNQNV